MAEGGDEKGRVLLHDFPQEVQQVSEQEAGSQRPHTTADLRATVVLL